MLKQQKLCFNTKEQLLYKAMSTLVKQYLA